MEEIMAGIKEIYLKGQDKLKKAELFTTGFEDLDVFTKHLERGDIMTIGGRPAMGKTSLALSLVNHLLEKNKNVLFFSIDVSKERFVQKLVAEKMGIPIFQLMEGKVCEKEVNIILDYFEDKTLEIVDKATLSIEDIENNIKEIKPEIVFIDYVQLIDVSKAPNRTEAINLVIKEIKRIAVENNVIIILLSQLSRAVESRCDKRPLLSDLRNVSLLEEISDIILFIYREAYYNPETEYPSNEIIIAKNTIAPTGTVSLDFKNGFFRNLPVSNTF